ncbi:MAG: ABC transporter ATP-binding protein [Lachnospiraceae bacterium]|nr:ABC transporter ATP-binding protein [Lachnospiraceae bacterium]
MSLELVNISRSFSSPASRGGTGSEKTAEKKSRWGNRRPDHSSPDNSLKETLKDISLTVEDGEFICIVGPSGCGKSTLLNIIAGLDQPTSGEMRIDGKVVSGPGSDRVMMFQEHALYPWLNVIDNVKFGMKLAKVPVDEQNRRAEHYLKMVRLWDYRDYRIHEISGGMKQRTALARALCMNSPILLMDEPFSALDKQTTNKLRSDLEAIWEETKKTVIFVTHSVEEAVFLADRIVVLSDNPGCIKDVFTVDLPRPRVIDSPEFLTVRHKILACVEREVEKLAQL